MPDLAKSIAEHTGKGYVVAPAGFGKTHLIAECLLRSAGRHLILTHTYAGVNALRQKLHRLRVPGNCYKIDTIASWALRLCISYPENSGWNSNAPEGDEWRDLYTNCAEFLKMNLVQRIVCSSYGSVYVDEYQDCTASQHGLILMLAEILPIRLFGDPLQAVFDFANEVTIDWDTHVMPTFEALGELHTPWRWKITERTELGSWLITVRAKLLASERIDLRKDIPSSVAVHICDTEDELRNKQINICKYFVLPEGEQVAALHKGDSQHKAQCHRLAKNTGGRFSSIEEIEGKRLLSFVKTFDRCSTDQARLLCAMEFSRKSMSGVNSALSAGTRRGEIVKIGKTTKNPNLVESANVFLEQPTPLHLRSFLQTLKSAPETALHARDLFNRLLKVLCNCQDDAELSLTDAASKFQTEFRHSGRPVRHPKVVSTTLLMKGLEFDHAIVLDSASLSKTDLYVALTRGSKSLTIITSDPVLKPEG